MKKNVLIPRKKPSQKRSAQMVDDILQGAIRVLKQQGGRHFNTIRVAEETGISVGSLYQYFPNKESILFQIQYQEWQATARMLLKVVSDVRQAPKTRLQRCILAFFESEFEEADLRKALAETGVMVDETRELVQLKAELHAKLGVLIGEISPQLKPARRRFLAEFIFTTVATLAEQVTSSNRSKTEVRKWAETCTKMVQTFLGPRR